MFKISLTIYGFDFTDQIQLNGTCNEQFAKEQWRKYGNRFISFDKNIELKHDFEARGGSCYIYITPIK